MSGMAAAGHSGMCSVCGAFGAAFVKSLWPIVGYFMLRCIFSQSASCMYLSGLSSAVEWLRGRLLRTADDRDEDDGMRSEI